MTLLLWLFGCRHDWSWPFGKTLGPKYQVCLRCGAERDYRGELAA